MNATPTRRNRDICVHPRTRASLRNKKKKTKKNDTNASKTETALPQLKERKSDKGRGKALGEWKKKVRELCRGKACAKEKKTGAHSSPSAARTSHAPLCPRAREKGKSSTNATQAKARNSDTGWGHPEEEEEWETKRWRKCRQVEEMETECEGKEMRLALCHSQSSPPSSLQPLCCISAQTCASASSRKKRKTSTISSKVGVSRQKSG